MNTLLNDLKTGWQKVPEYKDVEAEYWVPKQAQIETCPHGCDLEIYEDTPEKWVRISGRDAYRQTRICRKHGFARIYVITGPNAVAAKWNPKNS
jgi:hypothetical protein